MGLRFVLNSSMLSGISDFPNNHFFLQFPFFKNIFNMLTNCRTRLAEQFAYLRLC